MFADTPSRLAEDPTVPSAPWVELAQGMGIREGMMTYEWGGTVRPGHYNTSGSLLVCHGKDGVVRLAKVTHFLIGRLEASGYQRDDCLEVPLVAGEPADVEKRKEFYRLAVNFQIDQSVRVSQGRHRGTEGVVEGVDIERGIVRVVLQLSGGARHPEVFDYLSVVPTDPQLYRIAVQNQNSLAEIMRGG